MITIYVGYFSEAEITAKITAISDAMDVVLSGGKSYRLNDTQGDVMVTRESLEILQKALDYWESKYNALANEGSEIISLRSNR